MGNSQVPGECPLGGMMVARSFLTNAVAGLKSCKVSRRPGTRPLRREITSLRGLKKQHGEACPGPFLGLA